MDMVEAHDVFPGGGNIDPGSVAGEAGPYVVGIGRCHGYDILPGSHVICGFVTVVPGGPTFTP